MRDIWDQMVFTTLQLVKCLRIHILDILLIDGLPSRFIRHQHGGFLGFVTIAVYGRYQYFSIYFTTNR